MLDRERVAALIDDAATLQMGIGGVPDAVLSALTSRRDLAAWSEMFRDGVLALDRAGALSSASPVTASFVFGSAELYDWVNRNGRVRLLRTEKTNAPGLIARQPRMVSVNGALQVDLFAQANAARVHGMIYSGFGGQTDFVVGALRSPGGRAIIALPSWHPKAEVSTVVPRLTGPVTSFQHSFIVSKQGAAAVWGHDAAAQAVQIIDAHPSVRDDLRKAGRDLGFRLPGAASRPLIRSHAAHTAEPANVFLARDQCHDHGGGERQGYPRDGLHRRTSSLTGRESGARLSPSTLLVSGRALQGRRSALLGP